MSVRPFGYVRRPFVRSALGLEHLVALFFVVALSTVVVGGVLLKRRGDRTAEHRTTARFELKTLQLVAEKYAVDHPGVCPSPSSLVQEKELSAASSTSDPWQTPYRIECRPGSATASALTVVSRSAGPDRQFDTKDDVSSSD